MHATYDGINGIRYYPNFGSVRTVNFACDVYANISLHGVCFATVNVVQSFMYYHCSRCCITSRKQVRITNTPYTPLLYSKTGVYKSIHFFLIFASKHRLWVLIRNASLRRFQRVPTINVWSKKKKRNILKELWN